MYSLRFVFIVSFAFLVTFCSVMSQPSLEQTRSLAVSATSTASDGYGLHVVRVSGGQVQHDLLDNNGVIISGYSSAVASGELPVITSFGGKLRVAMKTSQQAIGLFQSNDGGTSWTTIPDIPSANSDVYDLDSYTDGYGTQIVWATGTEGDVEVYHLSYKDNTNEWTARFNVTSLSAQEYGYRPKVTATATDATVAFVGGDAYGNPMYSRDLNLSSNTWDGAYATSQTSGIVSMNEATIDDRALLS